MQIEPLHNSEDSEDYQNRDKHTPFDGFVNVNDIVHKRRQLKIAQFNNPDRAWDENMNPETKNKPTDNS